MTNNIISPVAVYYRWTKSLGKDEILRKLAGEGNKHRGVDIRYVASHLATYGTNGQHCHPSVETLAGDIGCDVRTIQRHLKTLVELGWFTAKRRKYDSTDYSISFPEKRQLDVVPESRNDNQVSSRNDNQMSPNQEHIYQEHNIDQETDTTVSVNQEQKSWSPAKLAPERNREEVTGPRCASCGVSIFDCHCSCEPYDSVTGLGCRTCSGRI